MNKFQRLREIPRPPKTQTHIIAKFTSILYFPPRNGLKLSEWANDGELEANMKELMRSNPEMRETYWLAYFLENLRDPSQQTEIRDLARKHLWSFYQAIIYWATQNFWSNFNSTTSLWDWEELFDMAGEETFNTVEVEKTAQILRKLDIKGSHKQYVKTICYRNLTNWRDKQIGRNSRITHRTWDEKRDNLESDPFSLYKGKKIEQATIEQTSVQEENTNKKLLQDRVLSAIASELDKVEASSATAGKIGKTNVSLWVVLLLTYGLNLNQSGTAELLTLNQQPIKQSTIYRHIKPFVVKLQLKLLDELLEEIKENLGDSLREEEELIEKNPLFEKWSKSKQKEVDDCLKKELNERMFDLLVTDNISKLNKCCGEEMQAIIRGKLEEWYENNYEISIHASLLADADSLEKNVHKVVAEWVKGIIEDSKGFMNKSKKEEK